jgi:Phytanoyl-CoA dioxygenase (PhyH)
MGFFKRRSNSALVEGGSERGSAADPEELRTEIQRLTEANRSHPDRATERRLLRLRHQAGVRLLQANGHRPEHPEPDFASLPEADGLPEISRQDVTPELLRAAILRDGCLLVRGLVDREDALRIAAEIDRSFAARDGAAERDGYFEEFVPDAPFEIAVRPWIHEGGGVLAVDAPSVTFSMFKLFESAGVPQLVADYLGEPPLISAHKTTLRKAEPQVPGAWHQDGAFMGDVRALNLWLSLSRCGDESPGLDVVPRRLDEIVRDPENSWLEFDISQQKAEEVAAPAQIIRPIFEPGDALFFDELFLHQTGSDPSMPKPRFAIENWFFGGSAFPGDYAPITV